MIQVGSVVRSAAGRDKGRFFAVMTIDGEYAYIADGQLRRLDRQKRKKLKHLRETKAVLELGPLDTNNRLKKALASFNGEALEPHAGN